VRIRGRAVGSSPFPENLVNVRDVKVEMEGMSGNIPWGIDSVSEKFGLISLDDGHVGLSCTSP
jgi:hypothetical protein